MNIQIHCKYDELINSHNLVPHPKNRNDHPKEQIDRLAKLIKYQGIRAPIVVSKLSGCMVKGHGTLMAIQQVDRTMCVPVVYQEFESQEQEYAFVQSDNAIASWAELDLSGINSDVGDLGPDFDVDLLGLKDFTIDVSEKDKEGNGNDNEESTDGCQPGQVWRLGNHTLMCGNDNLEQCDILIKVWQEQSGEKAVLING